MRYVMFASAFPLFSGAASAASAPSPPASGAPVPPIATPLDYFVVHVLSNTALVISLSILSMGIIAMALQFRSCKASAPRPDEILRMSAVTLIITFSLALAAFLEAEDLKAAAPIFGLFSTIAGYLLGSSHRRSESQSGDRRSPKAGGPKAGRTADTTPDG